jgi:hypothetical protein
MIATSFEAPSIKFNVWAKRQTQLRHSLNQMARSSQNPTDIAN